MGPAPQMDHILCAANLLIGAISDSVQIPFKSLQYPLGPVISAGRAGANYSSFVDRVMIHPIPAVMSRALAPRLQTLNRRLVGLEVPLGFGVTGQVIVEELQVIHRPGCPSL